MIIALCQQNVALDGSLGGLGTLYANLALSLSALDVEVIVITATPQKQTGLQQIAEIVTLPDWQSNHRACSQAISQTLSGLNVDLVESSSWKAELYDYLLLPHENRKPVIVRAELPAPVLGLSSELCKMESLVIQRADALVAISSSVANALRTVYRRRETMIIANGVDTQLFFPRTRVKCRSNRTVWVGNYLKIKRLEWLLDIVRQTPEIVFDIVLPSPPPPQMLDTLSNVAVHHHLSQRSLAELFAKADVVISTSENESFGLSLLESMACGTPVLIPATLTGVDDFFRPGIDGLTYVSPEEAAHLLRSTAWEQLRPTALKQARQFTWDLCAQQSLILYRSLLHQRRQASESREPPIFEPPQKRGQTLSPPVRAATRGT